MHKSNLHAWEKMKESFGPSNVVCCIRFTNAVKAFAKSLFPVRGWPNLKSDMNHMLANSIDNAIESFVLCFVFFFFFLRVVVVVVVVWS